MKTDIGLFFTDSSKLKSTGKLSKVCFCASKRFEKVTTAFPDLEGYDFKLVASHCFNVYYIK